MENQKNRELREAYQSPNIMDVITPKATQLGKKRQQITTENSTIKYPGETGD